MQEKEQIREGARVGEKKVIMQGRSLFVGSNQNESDSGEEEFQKNVADQTRLGSVESAGAQNP